jgi:hypothetical protein
MAALTIFRQYMSGDEDKAVWPCRLLCLRCSYQYLIPHTARRLGLALQQVVNFPKDPHRVRQFPARQFAGQERIGTRRNYYVRHHDFARDWK